MYPKSPQEISYIMECEYDPQEAKAIGDKLGVNWDQTSLKEFMAGMETEHEHDDVTNGDPIAIGKIVLAHMKELPDYYTRLKKMEDGAGANPADTETGQSLGD